MLAGSGRLIARQPTTRKMRRKRRLDRCWSNWSADTALRVVARASSNPPPARQNGGPGAKPPREKRRTPSRGRGQGWAWKKYNLPSRVDVDFGLELSEDQRALRDTVREFARRRSSRSLASGTGTAAFPTAVIRKLGELGVMGLPFPEEYGGVGAGRCVLQSRLRSSPESIPRSRSRWRRVCRWAACRFCCSAPRSRSSAGWSPLARGETLGAFASTEPGMGSDVQGLQTTAASSRRRMGHQRHQGVHHQRWHGAERVRHHHGHHGSARLGQEGSEHVYRARGQPGLRAAEAVSQDGLARLGYARAGVPGLPRARGCAARPARRGRPSIHANAGWRPGWRGRHGRRARARLSGSLHQLGQATLRVRPANCPVSGDRVCAGRPQDAHRGGAGAGVPRRRAQGRRSSAFSEEAAQAKLFASELAVHAADVAMQVHGGYGYMEESAIPRFYRDAKILTIGEGTSEILKLVISRHMGLCDLERRR